MNLGESLKNNRKIILASAVFTAGWISVNIFDNYTAKFFESRKSIFENKLGLLFGKNFDLGEYSGLRINGIMLSESKIIELDNSSSLIEASNLYLGIMPFRSILNRKLVFKIIPSELKIDVTKDFFKKITSSKNKNQFKKNKFNYDIYFDINNKSNLLIKEIGLNTKIKGNILFKSDRRQFIGLLNSYQKKKGNLKVKINQNLKEGLFSFQIFTKGVNLKNLNYEFFNNKFDVKNAYLKSDFRFKKLKNSSFCNGGIVFNNLSLGSNILSSVLNSDKVNINCVNNKIFLNTEDLNYGTLISSIRLDIPLDKNVNNINFNGQIGYLESIKPEFFISGKLPFWFDKRGLNLGEIDSEFRIDRTQLSNLNFFSKNGIRGFITASGNIKGNLNSPKTSIDFNLDYPHFKGIRIRESWEGTLRNKNKGLLLKMKNRYSPIPSFLSLKLNSSFKLDNIIFSRIYDTNKGELNITKKNNYYSWKANNFPLNEIELSLVNNDFDRINGVMNGEGILLENQSYLDGKLDLSLGEYRNIKFENSKFDFKISDKVLYVKSSLYPKDGGVIDVKYRSNDIDLITISFSNVSTNWTSITAYDIYKFNKERVSPSGSFEDLKNIQIFNNDKSLDEQLNSIERVSNAKNIFNRKERLNEYLSKFDGKYNGNLKITSDDKNKYAIKTNLYGVLNAKNSKNNNADNKFSINLEGGLNKGKGSLKIKQIPLSLINLTFEEPKNFKGGIDLDLNYDLDKKSFLSTIKSNKTFISDYEIKLGKGKIGFNNSLLNIDASLILDKKNIPITLKGLIPINTNKELDLRLTGDQKVFDLIDKLSNDKFSFNKGIANLRMKVKGKINKPILNGFLFIKNGEIDFFNNSLKDINSTMIFDFDQIEIVKFSAKGSDEGKVFLSGQLPFYKESIKDKKSLNLISDRLNLSGKNVDFILDSNIFIGRSFLNPTMGGSLSLSNGYVDFGGNNIVKRSNRSIDKSPELKDDIKWPELNWNRKQNIEIISNESILNPNLFNDQLPNSLSRISFNDLKINFGPEFRVGYGNIIKAYLITDRDLIINGNVIDNLNARGQVNIKRSRANLYTTPFKQDKNKNNFIVFASRGGINPYINFSLLSKVPDTIIPITENNKEENIDINQNILNNNNSFGSFGIGNTRFIKIEATYKGFLDQLSFEDENQKIQLRSTPSYSRSQIVGLIGGNSANLINRAFISQLNGTNAFSERFQLSLYPALIENNESINNMFSNEPLNLKENSQTSSTDSSSSQAWVAEVGLDITDRVNFTLQTTPDRDDLPPLGILTFQANQYLELLGSFDSNGDWKSQVQLYWRFGD